MRRTRKNAYPHHQVEVRCMFSVRTTGGIYISIAAAFGHRVRTIGCIWHILLVFRSAKLSAFDCTEWISGTSPCSDLQKIIVRAHICKNECSYMCLLGGGWRIRCLSGRFKCMAYRLPANSSRKHLTHGLCLCNHHIGVPHAFSRLAQPFKGNGFPRLLSGVLRLLVYGK